MMKVTTTPYLESEELKATMVSIYKVDIKGVGFHFVIKMDKSGGIRLAVFDGQIIVRPRGVNAVVVQEEGY